MEKAGPWRFMPRHSRRASTMATGPPMCAQARDEFLRRRPKSRTTRSTRHLQTEESKKGFQTEQRAKFHGRDRRWVGNKGRQARPASSQMPAPSPIHSGVVSEPVDCSCVAFIHSDLQDQACNSRPTPFRVPPLGGKAWLARIRVIFECAGCGGRFSG